LEDILPDRTEQERKQRLSVEIERGARLRLDSNLITGQSYLQAVFLDPEQHPVMEVPWTPKHLYIPSAPSTFTTMKDSVDSILKNLEELDLKKIEQEISQLLATTNQAVVSADIENLSTKLAKLLDNADQTLADADLKTLSTKVKNLVEDADQAVLDANVKALSDELRALLSEARQTNQHLQALLADPDVDMDSNNVAEVVAQLNQTLWRIDQLVAQEGPRLAGLLADLSQMVRSLKHTSETLETNPSSLILSQPPSKTEALR
jgi:paraquat-inducible protein B